MEEKLENELEHERDKAGQIESLLSATLTVFESIGLDGPMGPYNTMCDLISIAKDFAGELYGDIDSTRASFARRN